MDLESRVEVRVQLPTSNCATIREVLEPQRSGFLRYLAKLSPVLSPGFLRCLDLNCFVDSRDALENCDRDNAPRSVCLASPIGSDSR
jgi:hypothetical protein